MEIEEVFKSPFKPPFTPTPFYCPIHFHNVKSFLFQNEKNPGLCNAGGNI